MLGLLSTSIRRDRRVTLVAERVPVELFEEHKTRHAQSIENRVQPVAPHQIHQPDRAHHETDDDLPVPVWQGEDRTTRRSLESLCELDGRSGELLTTNSGPPVDGLPDLPALAASKR